VVGLAPPANADVVAYLVNVTVRPGYNFPNADAAIGYGNSICDRVAAKMSYTQLIDQVQADFNTADNYQGAYLINQAVNELCPRRSGSCDSRRPATPCPPDPHTTTAAPFRDAAVASNSRTWLWAGDHDLERLVHRLHRVGHIHPCRGTRDRPGIAVL